MIQSISFFMNGESYYTKTTLTLFDLILYFNYNDCLLVIEHNNLISNKQNWSQIFIQDQDKIEIVTIVGGG